MKKEVSTIDVIRAFYISDVKLKNIFISNKFKSQKGVERKLKEIVAKANKINNKTLLAFFVKAYAVRFDYYINSSWELEEIDINEIGVWPRMGNIPKEFTYGNLSDTANKIKPYLKNKNQLTYETSRFLYIENIMKYAELISKYIPIIILEGNLIRHNKLIDSRISKKYKKTKFTIDDGNHRAVALALLGNKKILAYTGKMNYQNDLLYT